MARNSQPLRFYTPNKIHPIISGVIKYSTVLPKALNLTNPQFNIYSPLGDDPFRVTVQSRRTQSIINQVTSGRDINGVYDITTIYSHTTKTKTLFEGREVLDARQQVGKPIVVNLREYEAADDDAHAALAMLLLNKKDRPDFAMAKVFTEKYVKDLVGNQDCTTTSVRTMASGMAWGLFGHRNENSITNEYKYNLVYEYDAIAKYIYQTAMSNKEKDVRAALNRSPVIAVMFQSLCNENYDNNINPEAERFWNNIRPLDNSDSIYYRLFSWLNSVTITNDRRASHVIEKTATPGQIYDICMDVWEIYREGNTRDINEVCSGLSDFSDETNELHDWIREYKNNMNKHNYS